MPNWLRPKIASVPQRWCQSWGSSWRVPSALRWPPGWPARRSVRCAPPGWWAGTDAPIGSERHPGGFLQVCWRRNDDPLPRSYHQSWKGLPAGQRCVLFDSAAPPPVLESCNLQVWMSNSGKLAITSDLNQSAQLILGHPSGSGTRDVAGDLHLLHRLDVEAEVGGRGRPRWADVHDHQPVH